jgi:hypothetical protein
LKGEWGSREGSNPSLSRIREVKNYKELVSVSMIRQLCVLTGNYRSYNSIFPYRLGDRGPMLPNEHISKDGFHVLEKGSSTM